MQCNPKTMYPSPSTTKDFDETSKNQEDNEILEKIKCPICVEIPSGEIYQCTSGHILCSLCISKVATCPQCREPFKKQGQLIRVRALESLLESVKVKCPYSGKGCDKKVARKDMKEHEESCIYNGKSSQLCKILGFDCEHRSNVVPIRTSFQKHHFKTEHKATAVSSKTVSIKIDFFKSVTETMETDGIWAPVFFSLKSCQVAMFMLFNHADKSVSWIFVDFIDHTFFYEIQMTIKAFNNVGPQIQWKMLPVPLLDIRSDNVNNLALLRVPVKELNKSYTDLTDGTLCLDVKILQSFGFQEDQRRAVGVSNVVVKDITERVIMDQKTETDKEMGLDDWIKSKFFEMLDNIKTYTEEKK